MLLPIILLILLCFIYANIKMRYMNGKEDFRSYMHHMNPMRGYFYDSYQYYPNYLNFFYDPYIVPYSYSYSYPYYFSPYMYY